MKKLIVALLTAVTMLFGFVQPENIVSAEEYEKNILISCESKEIDINDIPENREVELNVSIENNPGFILLGMYVKYDLRLVIDDYNLCKTVEGEDGIIYQAGSSFTKGEEGYTRVTINTKNLVLSDSDGIVTAFKFKIPTDAKIGDEYKVEFITNRDHLTFFFSPNENELYREEYFPNHYDGLIRIVGTPSEDINNDVTQTKEDDKVEPEVSDQFVQQSITEAPKVSTVENSEVITEVTTGVSNGISMTEQTSITTVSDTVATTTSVTPSSIEIILSEESSSSNTTSVTEKTEHKEDNKRPYMIPIALSAMIIAAVAVVIAKRKRSK